MIKKFRRKFIAVAVLSLAIILFASFGGVVLATQYRTDKEITNVLQLLAKNNGQLNQKAARKTLGPDSNKDSLFKYRYFTLSLSSTGKLKLVDNTHISTISASDITSNSSLIKRTIKNTTSEGSIMINSNPYRFILVKSKSSNQTSAIFLDTTPITASYKHLFRVAIFLGISGLIFFTLILFLLSNQAIKPIVEAYEKQRRFITNAGHELKTPLAIISANTEMEEMIGKSDEWTESTKEQVERLTMLINQLISLARMSEKDELILERVNFSDSVKRAANSFKSLIQKDGKNYDIEIESDLFVNGEKQSLYELVNILIDNANKYCDEAGRVSVNLNKGSLGRNAILQVKNSFKDGKSINYNKFFERFYRSDESHNSQKGGFGIGLSMAQDLVRVFGGKINASYDGKNVVLTVILKLRK
ncbi:HAMP domain-containing histidine kinase [Lactobacillus mulieris]|uniref:sensor histidine kinase n=1 Tax=Lactobacillus mulieris TaxID=2508708 RepID=UPI0014332E18|nr:HAMP domain-containing sensor histidine kinase [Lactobacillus mulieris]MCF1784184.1 HAMP domain-containing histidine kinase [Lactobacillus mulieris]MCW8104977.1 HAMP domain-containing histidine kinase [Lactobacillus mulieris]MDK6803972.1 HAMP domain-containing sensor histidine kinase [Lactobacillus mulieris]MDK8383100.1 HAMP domain-containing sensor histidine kinase [Lactobacillus mulieris]MDT9621293.1 HAMP domain-containing sensor histidine kinase [Lactobacillus mulieris]